MAINIRDGDIQRRIKREQSHRGYESLAKTACVLLIERLTQLEDTRSYDGTPVVRTGPGGEYVRDWPTNKESK